MRRGLKRTGLAGQIAVLVGVSFVAATAQSQATSEDVDLRRQIGAHSSLHLEYILDSVFGDRRDGDYVSAASPGDPPSLHGAGLATTHFGKNALFSLTSGIENSAFGRSALEFNTSGSFNSGTGAFALQYTTTGSSNTGTGAEALLFNTTGSGNTGTGAGALTFNKTGSGNTGTGGHALNMNTTGSDNTAVGAGALAVNTAGGKNTAVGSGALAFSTGGKNTAIGWVALGFNTTGIENTAIGTEALVLNSTGRFNTAISPKALELNTTGEQNVAIGLRAGSFNETGSRNIFIGSQSGANSKYVSAENQLVIHGNASTSPLIEGDFKERTLRINGDFSATTVSEVSDVRLKRDIQPIENALGSILRLGGKTFTWRFDEFPEEGFDDELDLGLIAQEVEEVLPQLVQEDRDGYKAIEYGKLAAVLVEAMKEQQNQIEQQQAHIASLLSRVEELELRDGS